MLMNLSRAQRSSLGPREARTRNEACPCGSGRSTSAAAAGLRERRQRRATKDRCNSVIAPRRPGESYFATDEYHPPWERNVSEGALLDAPYHSTGLARYELESPLPANIVSGLSFAPPAPTTAIRTDCVEPAGMSGQPAPLGPPH